MITVIFGSKRCNYDEIANTIQKGNFGLVADVELFRERTWNAYVFKPVSGILCAVSNNKSDLLNIIPSSEGYFDIVSYDDALRNDRYVKAERRGSFFFDTSKMLLKEVCDENL